MGKGHSSGYTELAITANDKQSTKPFRYMAYLGGVVKKDFTNTIETAHFLVHSLAVASYRGRSVLYRWAMSGTRGSSGLGSVSIEQIESSTVMSSQPKSICIVAAGNAGNARTF